MAVSLQDLLCRVRVVQSFRHADRYLRYLLCKRNKCIYTATFFDGRASTLSTVDPPAGLHNLANSGYPTCRRRHRISGVDNSDFGVNYNYNRNRTCQPTRWWSFLILTPLRLSTYSVAVDAHAVTLIWPGTAISSVNPLPTVYTVSGGEISVPLAVRAATIC